MRLLIVLQYPCSGQASIVCPVQKHICDTIKRMSLKPFMYRAVLDCMLDPRHSFDVIVDNIFCFPHNEII